MRIHRLLLLIVGCCCFAFTSCEKEETKPDYTATKKEWMVGAWKQKDLLLGVSTSVEGIPLVEGSSMVTDPTINMLLTEVFGGNPFVLTANNSYMFEANGSYSTNGEFSLVQPDIGSSGTWDLEVYGSVLALFPSGGERVPNWVNTVRPTELNLGITVNVPGLGAVPMNLLLEKQ